jgi:PEP-CTERM motif
VKVSLKSVFIAVWAILAASATHQVSAAIIAADDFSTDGPLAGMTPDVGANWIAHAQVSGLAPVQVVGGAAILESGSGFREDVSVDWTGTYHALQAGDVVYAGFDFNVRNHATPVESALLAALKAGNFYNSRVWVTADDQGDYSLAYSGDSSITDGDGESYWNGSFNFNQTYRAVIGFDYDSGISTLWVNPASAASVHITATETTANNRPLAAFALNQGEPESTIAIDNLIVATTFAEALTSATVPEPTSLLLILGGCLGLVAAARRRS